MEGWKIVVWAGVGFALSSWLYAVLYVSWKRHRVTMKIFELMKEAPDMNWSELARANEFVERNKGFVNERYMESLVSMLLVRRKYLITTFGKGGFF